VGTYHALACFQIACRVTGVRFCSASSHASIIEPRTHRDIVHSVHPTYIHMHTPPDPHATPRSPRENTAAPLHARAHPSSIKSRMVEVKASSGPAHGARTTRAAAAASKAPEPASPTPAPAQPFRRSGKQAAAPASAPDRVASKQGGKRTLVVATAAAGPSATPPPVSPTVAVRFERRRGPSAPATPKSAPPAAAAAGGSKRRRGSEAAAAAVSAPPAKRGGSKAAARGTGSHQKQGKPKKQQQQQRRASAPAAAPKRGGRKAAADDQEGAQHLRPTDSEVRFLGEREPRLCARLCTCAARLSRPLLTLTHPYAGRPHPLSHGASPPCPSTLAGPVLAGRRRRGASRGEQRREPLTTARLDKGSWKEQRLGCRVVARMRAPMMGRAWLGALLVGEWTGCD